MCSVNGQYRVVLAGRCPGPGHATGFYLLESDYLGPPGRLPHTKGLENAGKESKMRRQLGISRILARVDWDRVLEMMAVAAIVFGLTVWALAVWAAGTPGLC